MPFFLKIVCKQNTPKHTAEKKKEGGDYYEFFLSSFKGGSYLILGLSFYLCKVLCPIIPKAIRLWERQKAPRFQHGVRFPQEHDG